MDINFEHYKVFYYVASSLSFSEAASKLFISQSAVSQSVKLLEEKLGAKLFMRNTKQVKLTHDGDMLFKHIEQAFNLIKIGERSIQEVHSLQRGEIRIGASDTICRYYLLKYFKRFHELYPQIKISITNRPSTVCAELLNKGLIDVSIANLPDTSDLRSINIIKLKTFQDVFIAGQSFSQLEGKLLTPAELAKYPLLMLERPTITRTYFDSFFEKSGVFITPEIELGSVDLLVDLVKIGLGISFICIDYIEKELTNNELFVLEVNTDIAPRQLGILTHNNLPVPVAAQKFIELLQNERL